MPRRILIIDDSELVLEASRQALVEAGYEVETSTEPTLSGPPPDLVLLDVQMPQVFGDDVARFFREERGIDAPIYLYSTVDEAELEVRAKDAGADGYISKGWGLERLVERVRQILGNG